MVPLSTIVKIHRGGGWGGGGLMRHCGPLSLSLPLSHLSPAVSVLDRPWTKEVSLTHQPLKRILTIGETFKGTPKPYSSHKRILLEVYKQIEWAYAMGKLVG